MPRSATEPGNTRRWNEKFDELKAFKEIHGHCKVPQNEAHGALGKWVKLQRKKRSLNKMPADRVARLEAIGFAWSGNVVPRKADQWQERFEQLKRLMAQRGTEHSQVLPSISKENPSLAVWISEQRKAFKDGTLDDESVRKLDEIGFAWKVDPVWNRYFKALQTLVTKHGTVTAAQEALEASIATSPDTKTEEGAPVGETAGEAAADPVDATDAANKSPPKAPKTGKQPSDAELLEWITEQKTITNVASKTVSVEQGELLQQLAGWSWEDHSWTTYFVQLKAFKRKRGHCRVSTKSGGMLGKWVAHQRDLYANTKEGAAAAAAAAAATETDPTAEAEAETAPDVADQDMKITDAPAVPVEGTSAEVEDDDENILPRLNVPDIPAEGDKDPDEVLNADATMLQPDQVEDSQHVSNDEIIHDAFGDQTSLSRTQIEALDAIGFIWKPIDGHSTWDDMYMQLKEYKKEYGHCMVPKRNKDNPRLAKLGVWVGKQRERYKNMLIAAEEARQIAEGILIVPAADADAAAGAPAVRSRKKNFHRPPLQPDQVEKLNALSFVWEAGAKSDFAKVEWDTKLEELKAFEKEHGHSNVSAKLKGDGGQLGRWIKTQRERYHGTKKKLAPLTEEQIAKLEEIPGFSWRPSNQGSPDDSWDVMFQEMVKYREQYGDCLVPQKYGKLGGWVDRQRKRYKATQQPEKGERPAVKNLTEEQIAQLNSIEFVWQVKQTPKRKLDDHVAMDDQAILAPSEDDNPDKRAKTEPIDPVPSPQAPLYHYPPNMHEHPPPPFPPHPYDPTHGHPYQDDDNHDAEV